MEKSKLKALDRFSDYKLAVIVGNGPSVNDYKWDSFAKRKETLFLSCNRVSIFFNKTSWIPDIFSCFTKASLENEEWIKSIDECLQEEKIVSFVDERFKQVSKIKSHHSNCYFMKNILEHSRHKAIEKDFIKHNFQDNVVKSYSATATLFQICDNLNIKRIAIVGQDGYTLEKGKNHFDKKYIDEASNFSKSNDRIISMHKELNRYFSKKNVKVYNSSKVSILKEIYEFKDLNLFVK
jgi:hypothetical protein